MSAVDKARSELERLQVEAESHRARLSEIEAEIREVEAFIRGWMRFAKDDDRKDGVGIALADNKVQRTKDIDKSAESAEVDSVFHGQGLPSAVSLLLRREAKAMTIAEITRGLENGGVRFAAKRPEMSVDWALRRAAEAGQIERVGGTSRPSKWAAVSDPPPLMDQGDVHSAITRAGLALAKERGVRLGPPMKVTEEHRILAISMFEERKTIAEIAKACGVSAGAIGRRIREWREEGHFPQRRRPKQRKSEPETRDQRIMYQ